MPAKEENSKQLVISFDHDSLISKDLEQGRFSVFAELNLPEEHIHWDRANAIIRAFSSQDETGLSFVIRHSPKTPVKALAELKTASPAPFLLVLSGKRTTLKQLREDSADARSFGIRNFLAVTGDMDAAQTPEQDGTYLPLTPGYTDSTDILAAMNDPQKPQTLAAAFNPYMYTPESVCMQYSKLAKKLSSGAQVIIAQAGWDIAKAQELQWVLQMGEQFVPVIARMRILTPAEAGALNSGPLEPGVSIPVPVAAKLMRLKDDADAFRSYQETLAALLATGYKKLGYAGILLAGNLTAEDIRRLLNAFTEMDKTISSYNDWLEKWNDFLGDTSMAPAPTPHATGLPYYLFEQRLQPDLPFFSKGAVRLMQTDIPLPPKWLSLKTALLNPAEETLLTKAARAILKTDDAFSDCYGLDNSSCPKRLVAGPCGNTRSDGYCEANHAPCFFQLVARIAAQRNELTIFEQP